VERKLERRADEEITHKHFRNMICDVHFGDTRNDITPATAKWLPNNHPEALSEAVTTPIPCTPILLTPALSTINIIHAAKPPRNPPPPAVRLRLPR
jgi:hypothetical protein